MAKAILRQLDIDASNIEFVQDRAGHDLRYAIDSSKAKKDLGWVPEFTDFESNINELVELYSAKL